VKEAIAGVHPRLGGVVPVEGAREVVGLRADRSEPHG